jgi:hypothetical protein
VTRSTAVAAATWVVSLLGPPRAAGQDDFVAAARAGTARYRDRAAAIADGYRQVGPDFPGMGEHWVNAGLVVQGVLDPARPTVLEYAEIDGRPRLVGVAYASLVDDPRAMPAGLNVPAGAWHTHDGSVDEESFVRSHAGVHAKHAPERGPALAIVHAWIWIDNPAGLFATDNWALPCARLGFAVPGGIGPDAGRALALAAGGTAYYRTLVRVVGHPDSAEAARLDQVWSAAAREIAAHVGRGDGATPLQADQVAWLRTAWRRAWAAVLAAASPAVRARLAALQG